MRRLRRELYQLIFFQPGVSGTSTKLVMLSIQALIMINVVAVVLESVASIRQAFGEQPFVKLETFSIGVFVAEYLCRVWTSVEDKRYEGSVRGRLKYMLTPLAIIDLLAISPAFIAVRPDIRIVRILRMLRLLRLGKMARYSQSLNILGRVLNKQKEELLIAFFIFTMSIILSGALVYFAEVDAQPETFSSIPAAMWWSVVTCSTVGYGDMVPITIWGKLVGTLTSVLGIGIFGLIASVLVAGFMEEFRDRRHHSD